MRIKTFNNRKRKRLGFPNNTIFIWKENAWGFNGAIQTVIQIGIFGRIISIWY